MATHDNKEERSSAEAGEARPGLSGEEAMPGDGDSQQVHQGVGPVAANGELSSYSGHQQPIAEGGQYLSGVGGEQPSSETQHPRSSTQENRAYVSSADYPGRPAAVEAPPPVELEASPAEEARRGSACADYSQEV